MPRRGLLPLPLLLFAYYSLSSKLTAVLGEGPYEEECSQNDHGPHDIVSSPGVMNSKYMWYKRGKKTYVPVVLDHSYSHHESSVIVGGLREIQQKTCVEFDIYDNEHEVEEKDFVYINKNTKRGCYSYIGRIGGKQDIGLPVGCISHRTSMHEMLHALGFRHEHVRYDRDDYIVIFWGNIRQGRESNFKKRSPSDLVSGPYDYDSIMHYERKAFSKNGMETIRPLKPGAKIGVRQEMSYWDASKVNVVYGCGGGYSNSDVENLLEHSPALLRFNEDHNQSLPIAEFDDFNREEVTPRLPPRHGRHHNVHGPRQRGQENSIEGDHDQNAVYNPFEPPPPPGPLPRPRPPNSHTHPHSHPTHFRNHYDEEDEEEGRRSHGDNHYGRNEDRNRIHYGDNERRPQNREHLRGAPGDDFLGYLTNSDSDSRPRTTNNNNDNANGNGGRFYEDFYDF